MMNDTLDISSLSAGHPVSIYAKEKEFIQMLGEELLATDPETENQKFYNIFNQFQQIERRFERKENQLFTVLKNKGWTGPSKNIWPFMILLETSSDCFGRKLKTVIFQKQIRIRTIW